MGMSGDHEIAIAEGAAVARGRQAAFGPHATPGFRHEQEDHPN